MKVMGYVSNVEVKNNQGKDGQEYQSRYVYVEGLRLQLANKNIPLPETAREISASVGVQWHRGGVNGAGDGRPWASYQLAGWSYVDGH